MRNDTGGGSPVTDRGIIYLLHGTEHAPLLAVSVYSLRRFWDGPVTIFVTGQAAMQYAEKIAESGDCRLRTIALVNVQTRPRNQCYRTKTLLPDRSPYRSTIQLDADTVICGDFSRLWPVDSREMVLTESYKQDSTQRIRVTGFNMRPVQWIAEASVHRQTKQSHPAVNTGVLAYGHRSIMARHGWSFGVSLCPTAGLVDEKVMQALWPYGRVRWLDARYNYNPHCSPTCGGHHRFITPRGPPIIGHVYSRTYGKRQSAKAFWQPYFQRAREAGFAGIGDWAAELNQHID